LSRCRSRAENQNEAVRCRRSLNASAACSATDVVASRYAVFFSERGWIIFQTEMPPCKYNRNEQTSMTTVYGRDFVRGA
jgi:hypothetical protein